MVSPPKKPASIENKHRSVSMLTKREQFAAMAMQGAIASNPHGGDTRPATYAQFAVTCADQLLDQLNK